MTDLPAPPDSWEVCRRATQRHARTFYFASHVLPREKRRHAYAVYAFCRHVDDAIDNAPDPAARTLAFGELRHLLDSAYAPPPAGAAPFPWLAAFRETCRRRAIPRALFEDLLIGVEMDCGAVRIETWPELERYCYHVAAVVGLIMVHVLAAPAPELLRPARDLGTAMQLTNILRDIAEDWLRDRIYLPREELARFGVTESDIAGQKITAPFRALMRFQIERARAYYRAAEPGITGLPRDGSQLTVRLMSTIYGAILDEIEALDLDIYRRRARVSFPRKLGLAARAAFRRA